MTGNQHEVEPTAYAPRPGYGKVFAAAMALGVAFLIAAVFAGMGGRH
ncbi:hypothetical protein [Megalodesulfovibrio gigas]|nr:hypothetical protein [Megalodesulfovibrio gigas]